jgi:16S rRNA (guanine527-N7)-methyltransferase
MLQRLTAHLESSGAEVSAALCGRLASYLDLLDHWNRKINLTAFDLREPGAEALDRLIVEPLAASAFVRPSDRAALDIGSGGGSPAIPIALACPWLHMTMVEARVRKAAFLREAVRHLGLAAEVAGMRFEEVAPSYEGACDVVSVRAVRLEPRVWRGIESALQPAGRVLLFGRKTDIVGSSMSAVHANERWMVLERRSG